MHDALAERPDLVNYDQYTPEQQREIKKLCERYLTAPAEEEDDLLTFQSLRQMREMCRQFKMIVKELILCYTGNTDSSILDQGEVYIASRRSQLDSYENKSPQLWTFVSVCLCNLGLSLIGTSRGASSVGSIATPPALVGNILGSQTDGLEQLVGDEERGHGFTVGRAPDGARPLSIDR